MEVISSDCQETLQQYPCEYQFKVFGVVDSETQFVDLVHATINKVVEVSHDAIKQRPSNNGTYVCVTVVTYLHNEQQRQSIYQALQCLEGLKYLL